MSTNLGYGLPDFADDVAWLCSQLRISTSVVVGHSLGGMIVFELAVRQPSLPAAVVALDPGPIHQPVEGRSGFRDLATRLEGPDGETARNEFVDKVVSQEVPIVTGVREDGKREILAVEVA